MTFAGIRYRITSGIRIRGGTGMVLEDRRIPAVEDTPVIIRDLEVAVAGAIIRRVMVNGRVMAIHVAAMVIAITRRGVG